MLYDNGDDEAARAKVLDHFARRRTQQQWDFILSDIRFCQDILGPRFWEIFPEDTYLDLMVSPTLMGSGLNLQVENRSTRTLHNATLVLALHFTDMYPNDYVALTAKDTVPAVMANDTTSFGSVDIALDVGGVSKTSSDIVHHRAILVSNEAVVWVDTDAYRVAEAEEFRERRRSQEAAGASQVVHPTAARHPEFQSRVDTLLAAATRSASLEVESRYGADSVLIELPRELAILRPLFRLRYDGELFSASDNLIDGDHIALRFNGVHNFDEEGAGNLELLMWGPFGDVVLTWVPGADLTWRFEGLAEDG